MYVKIGKHDGLQKNATKWPIVYTLKGLSAEPGATLHREWPPVIETLILL